MGKNCFFLTDFTTMRRKVCLVLLEVIFYFQITFSRFQFDIFGDCFRLE